MNITAKPAVIFDVDDTLCDTFATRDGVSRPLEVQCLRWLAAQPIVSTVEEAMMWAASGFEIVLITARHHSIAEATVAQIEGFGIPVSAIFPRGEGDNRVDWKVKADALVKMLDNGFIPVAAYDDKPRNLDVFAPHCETVLV